MFIIKDDFDDQHKCQNDDTAVFCWFCSEKQSVNCCSDAQCMMVCVHVTSREQEFKQQQVATAWHILEPKVAVIKQVGTSSYF